MESKFLQFMAYRLGLGPVVNSRDLFSVCFKKKFYFNNITRFMFYFVVHCSYFSRMSCLQDFMFLNINFAASRILIPYFNNSTFGSS